MAATSRGGSGDTRPPLLIRGARPLPTATAIGLGSTRGLLHERVDEQRHDHGTQDDHPIRDLKAGY